LVAENNDKLAFTIRGAPVALKRPSVRKGYASMAGREGRGFGRPMYNPSQPKLSQFRELLVGLVQRTPACTLPFFQSSVPLDARMVFRIRRPNLHFVNSRRDRGLRATAPNKYVVGKVDLDNLVKFTLDAISGVAFVDDGQITQLTCQKVWDLGDGSTTCVVSKLAD
jgi:hypothetical protein